MKDKFEFTYNVYTGETKEVLPPIEEVILGIAVALESDNPIVYGGNRDEQDDVMEFRLDSHYISRLRHSHEYHDAVFSYLSGCKAHEAFADPDMRATHYDDFCELMAEYGVLGRIGLYQSEDIQVMDEHDRKLMAVSNDAGVIHLKLCELQESCKDLSEVPDYVKTAMKLDIDRYDTMACNLDNLARDACTTTVVHIKE